MLTVNFSALRNNMKIYLNKVSEECETLLIPRTSNQDNVIILPEDTYETLRENIFLLESLTNHQWLAQSIEQLNTGRSQALQDASEAGLPVIFSENAWKDYCVWQSADRKTSGRIDAMLADIVAADSENSGQPRLLQGDFHGCWSRRINDRDRLVYRVESDSIQILACRYH